MKASNLFLFFLPFLTRPLLDFAGARHSTDVIQKPDDVVGSECGNSIEFQCMAKVTDLQTTTTKDDIEIEWWYRDFKSDTLSAEKLTELQREGKISIHHEKFLAVRSTLVLHDVNMQNEGVYQCRSSASPIRHDKDVNVYQHWKIEEALVTGVECGRTTVQLPPQTVNDVISQPGRTRHVIDEVRKSTLTSIVTTEKRHFTNQTMTRSENIETSRISGQKMKQKGGSTPPTGIATGLHSSAPSLIWLSLLLIVLHFVS